MKKKRKPMEIRDVVKESPDVDAVLLDDTVALISYIRDIGLNRRSFSILRSSEARLKIKPVRYRLS